MPSKRVETRITIDASPARVYEVLTTLEEYPRWNSVLGWKTKGRPSTGARAWLRVKGSPLPIPVRFETVEPERELRWTGGPHLLMRGSHYFELHAIEGQPNKTELVHAEVFRGLFVPLMWPIMYPQLQQLYAAVNEGLAAHLRG